MVRVCNDQLPKTPRSRVPNFTGDEKALLGYLIKNKPIIESKVTDGESLEKKKAAWATITQEFNSQANVHKCDTNTLKKAWDNMKAFTRKARANERGSLFKTGGGPSSVPPQTPQQGAIISLVEQAAPVKICEVKNPFDSDGSLLTSVEDVPTIESHRIENECTIEIDMPTSEEPSGFRQKNTEIDVSTTVELSGFGQKYNSEIDMSTPEESNGSGHKYNSGSHNIRYDVNIPRKPADYVRREGVMRLKHLEMKKRVEMNILYSQLAAQEKAAELERKAAELKLQLLEIKIQAAKLEAEKNQILLDKALLEKENIKNKKD